MFEEKKTWFRLLLVVVGSAVGVGLVAASVVLSTGKDAQQAREAVRQVVKKEVVENQVRVPAQPPGRAGPLILPTKNYALFEENGGPKYFQYTDRLFEGRRLRPWRAGQYGFVRNPVRTDKGIVYTRFHEGIDIQDLRRDAAGEPLDTVRAVGAGTVAYVNDRPGGSNYGRYIVIEHQWDGSPYYSLYAHLSAAYVSAGERVRREQHIGRIGHTGRGINRRRAHLHFEINVLIDGSARSVQRWFTQSGLGTNQHGVYSGLNMRGLNPAAYFKALRANPDLRITEFIGEREPYYKITVPRRGPLDLLKRYPWLLEDAGERADAEAWEFSFTRGGFPLQVEPADAVEAPTVTMDPPVQGVNCSYLTYAHLRGTAPGCTLAPRGERYVQLLTIEGAGEGGTQAW